MSAQAEKKVLRYNFKRPDRISKNQIRSAALCARSLRRNFSSSISAYLRTVVEVSLENIAQISYAEFLNSVSDPTCYAAISLKAAGRPGCRRDGSALVFPMIDRLLGGAGRPMTNIRPMTEIEQNIISGVFEADGRQSQGKLAAGLRHRVCRDRD